jgi:hypothetical protein
VVFAVGRNIFDSRGDILILTCYEMIIFRRRIRRHCFPADNLKCEPRFGTGRPEMDWD